MMVDNDDGEYDDENDEKSKFEEDDDNHEDDGISRIFTPSDVVSLVVHR